MGGLARAAVIAASGLRKGQTATRAELDAAAQKLADTGDRKSTRLNSSHLGISYADFCLKKNDNLAVNVQDLAIHLKSKIVYLRERHEFLTQLEELELFF